MQGTMPYKRGRGKPRTTWISNISTWTKHTVEGSGTARYHKGPLSQRSPIAKGRHRKFDVNIFIYDQYRAKNRKFKTATVALQIVHARFRNCAAHCKLSTDQSCATHTTYVKLFYLNWACKHACKHSVINDVRVNYQTSKQQKLTKKLTCERLIADLLGFSVILLSFYRPLVSELAERNSTKIGHMVGSMCGLKRHVQNLGYPLPYKSGAPKPPFGTTSQRTATLTA